MSSELVEIEKLNIAEIYSGKGVDELIENFKSKAILPKTIDLSKKTGRDELKSHAYKFTRSKTALEKAAKDLVAEMDNKVKGVKAVSKTISSKLDEIADQIKAPAIEWEAREEERVKNHQGAVAQIKAFQITNENNSEKLKAKLEDLNNIKTDLLEEFTDIAKRELETSNMVLKQKIQDAIKYENEQKELAELRRQKIERDEKDRLDQIEAKKIEDAKKLKEQDEIREKQRLADIEKALKDKKIQEEIDAKKREEDINHRKKINNDALSSLVKEAKISEEAAKMIVECIAKGLISNVVIKY